uniref:ubiquitinyl hydrolase 1 n=1 Tax=Cafeteria roenbergensis TaxID=33653 RepID=A0A7S0JT86_CAFRO
MGRAAASGPVTQAHPCPAAPLSLSPTSPEFRLGDDDQPRKRASGGAEEPAHAGAASVSGSGQADSPPGPVAQQARPSEQVAPPSALAAAWACVPVHRHTSVRRALALLRVREGEDAAEAASEGRKFAGTAGDTRPLGATFAEREGRSVRPLTLAKCLDAFAGASSLDGWTCQRCRHVGAWRTTSVWRAPDLLVVHLLRFEQQPFPPFRRVKLNSLVDFPIDGMSVGPWATGPSGGADPTGGPEGSTVDSAATQAASETVAALSRGERGAFRRPGTHAGAASMPPGASAAPLAPTLRKPAPLRRDLVADRSAFTYDLTGVVNHSGGLGSGHYTAYARLPAEGAGLDRLCVNGLSRSGAPAWAGRWAHFNDHSVRTDVDPAEIVSNRAYLLFYRRRALSPRNLVALGGQA